MPFAWERFGAVLSQLFAPLMNGAVGDAQLSGDLGDGLAAGLHQSDGFLFEFFGVGFLDLCHDDPLPDLIEYISALVTLSNRGRVTLPQLGRLDASSIPWTPL